jgi:hypothetical protein
MSWRSTHREESLTAISATLRDDLTWSWARKSSLETRAAALVALGIGLVTVFLTLRLQLDVADALLAEAPSRLTVLGLIGTACALVAAVLVCVPIRYPGIPGRIYSKYLGEVQRGDYFDHREELIDGQIQVLLKLDVANSVKAWILFGGYLAVSAAVAMLTVALLLVTVWA